MNEDIRAELRELNTKIPAYIDAQRLPDALAAAEKAMLLVRENTSPENDPGIYAMQLQQLGFVYLHNHKIEQAEEAANQCLSIREQHFGPNHPVVGTTLHLLAAIVANSQGRGKSKELLQKAIDIWRQSFPDDHPFIVAAQNDLDSLGKYHKPVKEALEAYNKAIKKIKDADYTEAENLLQQAISINREKLGYDHPDVISCLNAYANLLKETGRLEESEATFKEALYMARKQKRNRNFHPYALVLSEYANLVKGRNRLIEAKLMFEELFALDHGFDKKELLLVRNNYASLISLLGDKNKALEMLDVIIADTAGKTEEIDDFDVIPLANKASILNDMGDVKEALVLYKKALAMKEEIYGKKHPSYARTLTNIATLYSNTRNFSDADETLEQVRQIYHSYFGETHPDYIHCLMLMANLSKSSSNTKKAKELYRSAREILLRGGPDHRLWLLDVEKSLATLENDKDAMIASFRKQLAAYSEAYGEQSLHVIEAKSNLAGQLLVNAIENKFDINEPVFAEMEQLFSEALQFLEKQKKDEMLADCQASYAVMFQYKGDLEKSYEFIRQALLTAKEYSKEIFSISSEKTRQQHAQNSGFYWNLYLTMFTNLPADLFNEYQEEAVSFIVSLKNMVVDVIAGEYALIQSSVLPEHRQTFQRIYELRSMIAARMLEEYRIVSPDEEDELQQWVREKEKLEASTALNLSYNNIVDSLMNVTLVEIQENMEEGEAIIDLVAFLDYSYKWGVDTAEADRYLLCVIRKNGSPQLIQIPDAAQLVSTAKKFVEHISTSEVESAGSDPIADLLGKRLRNRLIDPVMPYLEGITALKICPDGAFWNFPFEAIPLESNTCLIDRFIISYLSSVRDMVKRSENAFAGKNLVIADPDFDYSDPGYPRIDEQEARRLAAINPELFGMSITFNEEGPRSAELELYENLAGSREEGELLTELLKANSLFGAEALEKSVKEIHRPGILHIATHGFFWEHAGKWSNINANRIMASKTYSMGEMHLLYLSFAQRLRDFENELDGGEGSEDDQEREDWYHNERLNPMICSGLVLAGVNTWLKRGSLNPEAQDCHLLAEDILGIDLLGTQLVTLSACDSARGITQSQIGIFGMRRAFVLAGAGALVMSLWKVPDKQTQEFMLHFYKELLSGKTCAVALHDTRQWIRAKYHLPYYWAAFILQGRTGAITINN